MAFVLHGPTRTYSQTLAAVCLSSAGSKLGEGGTVAAAAPSIGPQSIAADIGFNLNVSLRADASAAIGECRRRGLGKIRPLRAADLWVQNTFEDYAFTLPKVPSQENLADARTAHLGQTALCMHLA